MDVLIIGAGFIGTLHKRAWENNGARVAAIVDPHLPEALKQQLMASGTQVFGSIGEAAAVCPSLAAASVCTPPGYHAEALFELLGLGIPVLMEKPVAVGQEDYRRMMEETERRAGRVMVGLTQRFYPEVQQAAAWIREGRIGRPLAVRDIMILNGSGLPSWYYDLRISGGGILITNGVHLLDRIQYMLDSELAETDHYDGVFDAGGFDRIAALSGRLASGISYHIHAEWSTVRERQETVIFGTAGRIELQSWSHAHLLASSGITETFSGYEDADGFEDKTLKGLTLEVKAFLDGLAPSAVFPKGLSLPEHIVTMHTIWQCYGSAGGGIH